MVGTSGTATISYRWPSTLTSTRLDLLVAAERPVAAGAVGAAGPDGADRLVDGVIP